MKKSVALFLTLVLLKLTTGQQVTVVEHDLTHQFTPGIAGFHCVNDTGLLSGKMKIARLSGVCANNRGETLVALYSQISQSANAYGANAFRVDSASLDSAMASRVSVSLYFLSEEELTQNATVFAENMIYVLGHQDGSKKKGRGCRLNGTKIDLMPLSYVAVQNITGMETTLSVGGFMGAKVWIKGRDGRRPEFFTLEGFGVGGAAMMPGQIGVSFNTGRIEKVDPDLGQFLISMMRVQKVDISW